MSKRVSSRRRRISKAVRLAVLTEAGYRCAVPNCPNQLAIDIHHLLWVSDGGSDDAANLLALCPNCHALHHRGEIPREALVIWKTRVASLFARDASISSASGHVGDALNAHAKQSRAADRRSPIIDLRPSIQNSFKGRDDDLERLHSRMSQSGDGQATAVVSVALHGLGGTGKTTLAVEYAWQHLSDHSALLFVSADKPDQLDANLAKLAESINKQTGLADRIDNTPADVINWLRENPIWLLILDNVDDEAARDGVRQLLSRLSGGRVIITGRLSRFPAGIETLPLSVLKPDDARKYLLEKTGSQRHASSDDNERALEIAQELGGLALALEIAAAHISERRVTFAEYLSLRSENREAAECLFHPEDLDYNHNINLAATWATSVSRLESHSRQLLERAAFLAPEPIPEELLNVGVSADAAEQNAIRALSDLDRYSLITRDPSSESRDFWVHRLVQDITRRNLRKENKETAASRLGEAAEWIQSGLEDSRLAHVRAELIPHTISVLYFLHSDDYRECAASDFFQTLAQSVIYGLLEVGSKNINPEYLASVFSEFYEVAPLIGAIAKFRRSHREAWKEIEAQLLKSNNYVLRYAIAANLAETCKMEPPEFEHVVDRFNNAKELNELECTGYALALVYATRPVSVTPHFLGFLKKLTECGAYPGPLIVSHLLTNLVFRSEVDQWNELRRLFTDTRFWNSKWDIVKHDIWDIEAAEAFMARPRRPLSASAANEVKECYSALVAIEIKINDLLKSSPNDGLVRGLLTDYFSLGQTSQRIQKVKHELAASSNLFELMKLLFAHPIWSVAEEAASVLSSLVKENPKHLDIIRRLLNNENWRVQYSANEAAHYAWNSDHQEIFNETMHGFHDHRTCEIRGLCAENLISEILSSGGETRRYLLEEFQQEIRYWLHDEDCWVLEHVFRLFQALHKRNVDFDWLLSSGVSRLFADVSDWYLLDREAFLRHIEVRKEELRAGP